MNSITLAGSPAAVHKNREDSNIPWYLYAFDANSQFLPSGIIVS